MKDEELKAIEERAKAATEGSWSAEERFEWRGEMVWSIEGPVWLFEDSVGQGDAEFIAHARSDVPALAAEVRRLRKAFDEADRHWNGRCDCESGLTCDETATGIMRRAFGGHVG